MSLRIVLAKRFSRLVLTQKLQEMDNFIHHNLHALSTCKLKNKLEFRTKSEAKLDIF